MPATEILGRRQCIPIIYCRGTHYEVGFDVGRTFGAVIREFVEVSECLNEEYLPAYESTEGKRHYEETLETVRKNFPQYVEELEGTAHGANVPFYKLFLLHMDNLILGNNDAMKKEPIGCTTICVNNDKNQILGHTEDALSDTLNRFYFVSAHITSDKPLGKWGVKEERFTSLCYAGHLPGYTMNNNHHGLVFSINTLQANPIYPGKTPRHFLTRALLAAENFVQAQEILRDRGVGTGDGCSINFSFLNQEGDRIFHNAEMAPGPDAESVLQVLSISPGEYMMHCNEYLRIPMLQEGLIFTSSKERFKVLKGYNEPKTKKDVICMLGDESAEKHKVFRNEEPVKTIAVGIFDLYAKTWALYSDNPRKTEPLVVLPLVLKDE